MCGVWGEKDDWERKARITTIRCDFAQKLKTCDKYSSFLPIWSMLDVFIYVFLRLHTNTFKCNTNIHTYTQPASGRSAVIWDDMDRLSGWIGYTSTSRIIDRDRLHPHCGIINIDSIATPDSLSNCVFVLATTAREYSVAAVWAKVLKSLIWPYYGLSRPHFVFTLSFYKPLP